MVAVGDDADSQGRRRELNRQAASGQRGRISRWPRRSDSGAHSSAFPAGTGVEDLVEYGGGGLAAGGLGRPHGGQGDTYVDEQDRRRCEQAEGQQRVVGR
jgi:hypothetical protein